jgi:sugar fermentation stimulation protein A
MGRAHVARLYNIIIVPVDAEHKLAPVEFRPALLETRFRRRYQRFFADVDPPGGGPGDPPLTVHCPNSGSMKHCVETAGRAWISDSGNPARKLRYTLEMLEVDADTGAPARVLVNTQRPNALVEAAVLDGTLAELAGADAVEREVKYGVENSRIDLRLRFGDRFAYVEVKNATMGVGGGRALFPDAVTTRGAKHLRELMGVVAAGHRGVLVFCAGRDDTRVVAPADAIDPAYGRALREAAAAGVEILAYRCALSADRARLVSRVPVEV